MFHSLVSISTNGSTVYPFDVGKKILCCVVLFGGLTVLMVVGLRAEVHIKKKIVKIAHLFVSPRQQLIEPSPRTINTYCFLISKCVAPIL